jgi:hypothetical protein
MKNIITKFLVSLGFLDSSMDGGIKEKLSKYNADQKKLLHFLLSSYSKTVLFLSQNKAN